MAVEDPAAVHVHIVAIVLTFVASGVGCVLSYGWPWSTSVLLPVKFFSAGVIISLAQVHIISEASKELQAIMEYPLAGVCSVAGLLFMMILEHLHHVLASGSDDAHAHAHTHNTEGLEQELLHGASEPTTLPPPLLHAPDPPPKDPAQPPSAKAPTVEVARSGESNRQAPQTPQPPMSGNSAVSYMSYASATSHLSMCPACGSPIDAPCGGCTTGCGAAHARHTHVCVARLNTHELVVRAAAPDPTTRPLRTATMAYLFEFACLFHSVFIGLSIGVTVGAHAVWTLTLAVAFHQLLEGVSLGVVLRESAVGSAKAIFMIVAYSLTTSAGIGAGMLVQGSEPGGGTRMTLVSGVFQAFSGGLLLYVALFQILAEELSRGDLLKASWPTKTAVYSALLLGAASMAFIAIWL